MHTLRNRLIAVAAIAIPGVIGLIVNSRQVSAQGSAPVHITSPLPLPVTVAGGAVGISDTIAVTNPQGATGAVPLVVSETDSPARQPFQATMTLASPGVQIPATKRLVIEFVSGACTTTSTGAVFDVSLQTDVGANRADHHHFVPVLTFAGGEKWFVFSQQTRIYADPGSSAFLGASSLAGVNITTCNATISGYLINP